MVAMATGAKQINHKLNVNANDPDSLRQAMNALLSEHEKQKELWKEKEQVLLTEKEQTERELDQVAKERDTVKVFMKSIAANVKPVEHKLVPLDPAPSTTCANSTKVVMARKCNCKHYQKFRFMNHTTSSVRKVEPSHGHVPEAAPAPVPGRAEGGAGGKSAQATKSTPGKRKVSRVR